MFRTVPWLMVTVAGRDAALVSAWLARRSTVRAVLLSKGVSTIVPLLTLIVVGPFFAAAYLKASLIMLMNRAELILLNQ